MNCLNALTSPHFLTDVIKTYMRPTASTHF